MIETKWEKLQNKLEDSRSTLSHYHDLMSLFADMNDSLADITQIQVRRHERYIIMYVRRRVGCMWRYA